MNRITVLASTRLSTVLLSVFPVVVALLSLANRDHYSGVSQAMSELALGPGGWLMTVAFVSLGAGSVLVARALRSSLPRARVAPVLLAVTGVLDVVSAVFHTNAAGQPATTSSTIHQVAGVVTFLILIATMFASAVTFRRDPSWRWFAGSTLGWAVLALAAFFLVPILGDDRFGLAQRIFVGVVLSWLITVSVLLSRSAEAGARDVTASSRESSRVAR
jgi:hypothetical protein